MAYSADDHNRFSRRVQKFMLRIQALRDEAAKLREIYSNETASGSDPNFSDTEIALEAEHVNAILYMQSFEDFNQNAAVATVNRTLWITPFIQIEQ